MARIRKLLGLLCMLAVWSALGACAPTPTPTALPATPRPSRTTLPSRTVPATTVTTKAETPVTTKAETPGATPALGTTAEQDLVTLRAAARDAQGGFLFYLDAPGRTNNPQVLDVAGGQPFEAVIVAGNYGVKDHDFVLLCIVDYTEVPCRGEASAKAFQFHLAPSEETRLQVNVPMDTGTHDILFLTFYDPGNHSTEQNFRQESRFLFTFYRAQVVAGGSDTRPAPEIAQRFSTKSDLEPGSGFFTISRHAFTDPAQAPWHEEESAAGAPVDFIAAYSNPEQVKRSVALMAFMDFEQVPWDASRSTYFAELAGGARADIPGVVTAPTGQGEHEFTVVAIDNPYLDLEGEVHAAEPRSFFANPSDRVLIHVK